MRGDKNGRPLTRCASATGLRATPPLPRQKEEVCVKIELKYQISMVSILLEKLILTLYGDKKRLRN
jgi:hypothetical protein